MSVFLCIDCGTSSCRAALISDKGEMVSVTRRPVAVERRPPAFAEVDPNSLWQQVSAAVGALLRKNPGAAVEAVGVSAMLGYVLLDARNMPLMPAVIWMDNRAEEQLSGMLREIPEENLYRKTGRRPTPELLAPKLLWLKAHRPEVFYRVRRVIGLKDEIVRRFTGAVATDAAHTDYTAIFNVHEGRPDEDILRLLKVPRSLFPEPHSATAVIGKISAAASRQTGVAEGIPVVVGSSDGTTAMYGAGVLRPNTAALVSGTTDVLMTCVSSPVHDPQGVLSLNTGMLPGTYLVGGAMGVGGGVLGWLTDVLETSPEQVAGEIVEVSAGSDGLLFFPGLTGERSPYWEETLTGGIVGIRLEHRRPHLLRAAMEGGAYRTYRLLKILQSCGAEVDRVRVVGGFSNLDVWNRIRADVIGLTVEKPAISEATLLGTAMFCRTGIDSGCSLRDLAQSWCPVNKRYEPDPGAHRQYRKIAVLFDEFVNTNAGWYRKLNQLIRLQGEEHLQISNRYSKKPST